MLNDYSMHSVGREVEERVNFQNIYGKKHIHYYRDVVNPVLSRVTTIISKSSLIPDRIPGTSNYKNDAITIALGFAVKMGDHKLAKIIKKFEQYDRELYENGFMAAQIAYSSQVSKNSRSDSVQKKRDEIKSIESDKKLNKKEKKKKIIALEKEIEKIICQGKKFEKKYEKKYRKHLVKARSWNPHMLHDEFLKVGDILHTIWISGVIREVNKTGSKEIRDKGSYMPGEKFYEIDYEKLDELYASLEEKFYSTQEKRTR